MKKGDERGEIRFPRREHSEEERIHMDVSAAPSSVEVDDPVANWTSSEVEERVRNPFWQRILREKDG